MVLWKEQEREVRSSVRVLSSDALTNNRRAQQAAALLRVHVCPLIFLLQPSFPPPLFDTSLSMRGHLLFSLAGSVAKPTQLNFRKQIDRLVHYSNAFSVSGKYHTHPTDTNNDIADPETSKYHLDSSNLPNGT